MTRPVHILPLGVLCVVLASAISPEVLAAPTSFEKLGDGPIPSNDLGLLGPVRARDGLKVDGHVSSCLSFAGAGAGAGAVHSRNQELDGNAVRRSLRNLKRRADFLDDPFSDTHEAAEHAPGQRGDVRSQVFLFPRLLRTPIVSSRKTMPDSLFLRSSNPVRLNLRTYPAVNLLDILDRVLFLLDILNRVLFLLDILDRVLFLLDKGVMVPHNLIRAPSICRIPA
ncbi:hypothetical protein FB446DRAFT_714232 [Lentinula raphanica]|nr:hypothetical protein FB446DRAFT_714232 [Lentinula raphanica]